MNNRQSERQNVQRRESRGGIEGGGVKDDEANEGQTELYGRRETHHTRVMGIQNTSSISFSHSVLNLHISLIEFISFSHKRPMKVF